MLILRILAVSALAAALAILIEDAERVGWAASTSFSLTTLGDMWVNLHASSFGSAQSALQEGASPWLWDRAIQPLLDLPVLVPIVALALMLWSLARRQRRRDDNGVGAQGPAASPTSDAIPNSELGAALTSCRGALLATALFSAFSNVLVLTGAMFMLQIYDRVLPSRSVPTLIGLAVLALMLFVAQGGLDFIRSRLLVRIGVALDDTLSDRIYDLVVRIAVRTGNRTDSLQPLRDLDSVRAFLSGMGPTALFDLPWIPFYLAIIFAFHPSLGLTALLGAIVLIGLTLLTEFSSRAATEEAMQQAAARHGLVEASTRNAEVLVAMGLTPRLGAQWRQANQSFLAAHRRANDVTGGLAAISRVIRLALQSAVLGLGAYLVILEAASAGIIIAASILTARALAPVDLAIAHWKTFIAARHGWQRLNRLFKTLPPVHAPMVLPAPSLRLAVESVSVVPPGETRAAVHDIAFTLAGGQGLGIVGPSGSGKSSLARAIVGAWPAVRGKVRLDGSALDQWAPESLGAHIGYLPQDVELFAGTVAQNVSRFEPDANPETIVAAARAADVHGLIVQLPKGYETQIGDHGTALSAGQRQRIGLARALYGKPFFVVLDEPDASLDTEGLIALSQAILEVRKRGGVVIVITHRHRMLGSVDQVLVLDKGRAVAAGPRDAVLERLRLAGPGQKPLKVVPGTGTASR